VPEKAKQNDAVGEDPSAPRCGVEPRDRGRDHRPHHTRRPTLRTHGRDGSPDYPEGQDDVPDIVITADAAAEKERTDAYQQRRNEAAERSGKALRDEKRWNRAEYADDDRHPEGRRRQRIARPEDIQEPVERHDRSDVR